jgi:hypothetical protein
VLKPAAISQNDFFDWNPALNPTSKFLPAGYRIKVPPEKVDGFVAAQRKFVAAPAVRTAAALTKGPDARSGSGRTVGAGKTVLKRKGSNRPSAANLPKSRRLADGRTVATEPRIRTPKG